MQLDPSKFKAAAPVAGTIDLSAVKPVKIEAVKEPTALDVQKAVFMIKKIARGFVDMRVGLMLEVRKHSGNVVMSNGSEAKDLQNRLAFVDQNLRRCTDLIKCGHVVILNMTADGTTEETGYSHEELVKMRKHPHYLAQYPTAYNLIKEAAQVVIDNVDKPLQQTTNKEAIVIAAIRDTAKAIDEMEL